MLRSKAFQPEPGSFVRKRRGLILLVDDYPDARATLRDVLENCGHGVIEAKNGQEAINILASAHGPQVALILLDLQMPVMDGWQFLALLRNYVRLATIPVVVVSAHAERLDASASPLVVGRLQVPYDPDELLAMVNAYTTPPSLPPPPPV